MYRELQDSYEINIIFDNGGLGDDIARLPAVKYICENHPQLKVNLWVKSFFKDFAMNCLRNQNLTIWGWNEMKENFKEIPARCFAVHRYANLASHLTDHSFHMLCYAD